VPSKLAEELQQRERGDIRDMEAVLTGVLLMLGAAFSKYPELVPAGPHVVGIRADIARVRGVYASQFAQALNKIGREAAALGRAAFNRQAKELGLRENESTPQLATGLRDFYLAEAAKRASQWAARAESTITRHLLEGQSIFALRAELQGLIPSSTYALQGVVRTEAHRAANRQILVDAVNAVDDPSLWYKELVATFDDRTGEDSRMLHGQRRALNDMFWDPYFQRKYPYPPNRTNDREIMIFGRITEDTEVERG
jgi:hypothetical protein